MDMLNQEINYVYEIDDRDSHNNNRCLIKSKIKPEEMKNLIFYIQYKYKSIIKQDALTADEITGILVNCYEIENSDYVKADEIINLQDNYSSYFNNEKGKCIVDNFQEYEVRGLIGELKKIVCLTIEMWR